MTGRLVRRRTPSQVTEDALAVVGLATVLTATVGGLVWVGMTVEAWLRDRRRAQAGAL